MNKSRFHLIFLPAFFYFISAVSVYSQGFRFGFGGSEISCRSNYSAIPDFRDNGYSISFGWQFNENLSVLFGATIIESIKTDTTENIYYPDDNAEFGIIDLSVRYYLTDSDRDLFLPWLGIGYAIENANWDTFFYSVTTTGFSVSAGLEYKVIYGIRLNAFYQYQATDGYDTYDYGPYDLTTSEFGIQIHYLFDFHGSCLM